MTAPADGTPHDVRCLPLSSLIKDRASHWRRSVGEGPGRHLEIFVPAGLERMFEEIGEPVGDPDAAPPPPDPARLLEAAPRYGVDFKLPG